MCDLRFVIWLLVLCHFVLGASSEVDEGFFCQGTEANLHLSENPFDDYFGYFPPATDTSYIDILVLYSDSLSKTFNGDVNSIKAFADNQVARLNLTLSNSRIPIVVELIGLEEVSLRDSVSTISEVSSSKVEVSSSSGGSSSSESGEECEVSYEWDETVEYIGMDTDGDQLNDFPWVIYQNKRYKMIGHYSQGQNPVDFPNVWEYVEDCGEVTSLVSQHFFSEDHEWAVFDVMGNHFGSVLEKDLEQKLGGSNSILILKSNDGYTKKYIPETYR